MYISLIIATKNRAASLSACLAHIREIIFDKEWELVVVDNGSTDNTARVVKSFISDTNIPTKYLYEPLAGVSNARNRGVRESLGTIVAITDDDCYVDPSFLDAIAKEFVDQKIGYISGRILQYDSSHYRCAINESQVELSYRPYQFIRAGDVVGANMAFRRAALDEIGGFDPFFGGGAYIPSAEECDAALRASLAGWQGKYTPNVVVHHNHGRTSDTINSTLIAYDIGRGAYHTKIAIVLREYRLSIKGWMGLARRSLRRPASIFWELYGAYRYVRLVLRN